MNGLTFVAIAAVLFTVPVGVALLREPVPEVIIHYDSEGDTEYLVTPSGGITPRIGESGGYICRRCDDSSPVHYARRN